MDNTLVAPEIDANNLESGQIISQIRNSRILHVTEKVMLEYVALEVCKEGPRIAGCAEKGWLSAFLESHDGDAVRMVLHLSIQRP